jgi:hypothetical protein
MSVQTVGDLADLRGAKRDLLHEFDHLLRDALTATRCKARDLDLADGEVETAFVTVMMTVAAGAALAAAESPGGVTEANFAVIARDAMAWARRRMGDISDRKH